MDHTPGARQFVSLDKFKEYYLGRKLIVPEQIDAYISDGREMQAKYAAAQQARRARAGPATRHPAGQP